MPADIDIEGIKKGSECQTADQDANMTPNHTEMYYYVPLYPMI